MYESKCKSPETDELFSAVLSLKDLDECYRFFDDLCTIVEINSFTQRFAVAKMLHEGNKFNTIAEKTGASTTTISRVNRCLQYGADGYNIALKNKPL